MTINSLINILELLKSSTDIMGDEDIVISINGTKYEIRAVEPDNETSDVLIELGTEV